MPGLDPAALLAVWERGRHEAPLDRALTLLSAAVPAGAEASGWDLGSRDALLAAVLEGFTGATAWGCIGCSACAARLDVPVDIAALARAPVRARAEQLRTAADGATVAFRLPTTDDLRVVPGADAGAARRALVARCTGRAEQDISDELAAAVEEAMEEASPVGAVEFAVGCPDCGATTVAALDVPALLWAEVELRATALLRDVHVLATAYGWTEADVLSLSPARRAAYLELAGA
jgi:hypothetical protein